MLGSWVSVISSLKEGDPNLLLFQPVNLRPDQSECFEEKRAVANARV